MTDMTQVDAEPEAPAVAEETAVAEATAAPEETAEEPVATSAASEQPDLVLDATDDQESVELGGWVTDEDEEEAVPVESPYDRPGRWYVVHTYSGYENKV